MSDARSPRSRRILRVGTELHRIVQQAVSEHPALISVYHEVNCDWPERNIAGSADSLVQLVLSDDGETWEVQEYKSISENGFKFLRGAPKPDHADQGRSYAYVLRHHGGVAIRYIGGEARPVAIPPLGDKLQRIRITYVSKNDLRIEEFTVLVTPQWEAKFEAKLARLDRYRLDGTALPPRLPVDDKGKRPWNCGYCDWATRCWDQDEEGVGL